MSDEESLLPFPVTPGDQAAADQFIAEADNEAIRLLGLYLSFCQATDDKNRAAMMLSHAVFMAKIRALLDNKPDVIYGTFNLLCHYLYVMLWERHGSWDNMTRAIEKGQLFTDGDENQQGERDLLSMLKQQLKE